MAFYINPTWQIALMVLGSWCVVEIIKGITGSIKVGKVTFHGLLSYGGMPSAHTAFVTSIAFSIYLVEGFSTAFVISIALAVLIVRDMMIIRRELDSHESKLAKISKNKHKAIILSHTPTEIFAGFCVGIIVPFIIHLIL